jgi:hypothetical protein
MITFSARWSQVLRERVGSIVIQPISQHDDGH